MVFHAEKGWILQEGIRLSTDHASDSRVSKYMRTFSGWRALSHFILFVDTVQQTCVSETEKKKKKQSSLLHVACQPSCEGNCRMIGIAMATAAQEVRHPFKDTLRASVCACQFALSGRRKSRSLFWTDGLTGGAPCCRTLRISPFKNQFSLAGFLSIQDQGLTVKSGGSIWAPRVLKLNHRVRCGGPEMCLLRTQLTFRKT